MMDSPEAAPPRFRLYRSTAAGACVMIQHTQPRTGSPVNASELICFEATRNFPTDWHKLTIKKGSKLILTAESAAGMLADGRILAVPARPLITRSEAEEQRAAARWEAGAPRRKLLREKLIKAGRLKPIGDQVKPQA